MFPSSFLLVRFLATYSAVLGGLIFNMIENPISANIQIRFINFVAFESDLTFSAKHKFENFILTVCEINFYDSRLETHLNMAE